MFQYTDNFKIVKLKMNTTKCEYIYNRSNIIANIIGYNK